MMKFAAYFALLISMHSSYGASFKYEFEPGRGQTVAYERGDPTVTALGPNSYVSVKPFQDGKRIQLMVFVGNRGELAFEFSEANISAAVNNQPIEIVGAAQLRKEANRLASWQTAASGLAAGLNSANGRTSTHNGSVTTTTPYGATTGRATYSGTISSASNPQEAARQSAEQSRQIEERRSATVSHIEAMSLERTTIPSGELIGGFVAIKAPKPRGKQPIQIQITAAGEAHVFTLREIKE